jgi:hypothetical protein
VSILEPRAESAEVLFAISESRLLLIDESNASKAETLVETVADKESIWDCSLTSPEMREAVSEARSRPNCPSIA